jgi:hypothetical protein
LVVFKLIAGTACPILFLPLSKANYYINGKLRFHVAIRSATAAAAQRAG